MKLTYLIPLLLLNSCFSPKPDKRLAIETAYIDKKTVTVEGKEQQYDALYVCFNRLLQKEDFQCEFGPRCSHYLRFKFNFSNGKLRDWYTPDDLGHLSTTFGNHDYIPQKCFSVYVEPFCYKGYARFNDCSTREVFEKDKVTNLVIEYYWQDKTKRNDAKTELSQTFKLDKI